MKKISIIYHSAKGHTRELANAIHTGTLKVPFVESALIEVTADSESPWATLAEADAIIFGSPTYMGTVSAPFKRFMDQSGDFWLE